MCTSKFALGSSVAEGTSIMSVRKHESDRDTRPCEVHALTALSQATALGSDDAWYINKMQKCLLPYSHTDWLIIVNIAQKDEEQTAAELKA